jgi:uncharacterized membrane protein
MPKSNPNFDSLESVLDKNIQTIIEHRKKLEAARSLQSKIIDSTAAFAGSVYFVYLHALLLFLWRIALVLFPQLAGTLSFQNVACVASLEAIFLSTFLMINQNRLKNMESRRENLDLQVSLLIEHELTRIARICDMMALQLGLDLPAVHKNLHDVKKDIPPEKVLDRIQAAEEKIETQSGTNGMRSG